MKGDVVIQSTRCLICDAQATGFHFEAQSCSACAAFFRRTVSLTKTFTCITGREDCMVHYSMHQICRSCRHKKCLASGMKPAGVQPKKGGQEIGRAFFTKSGLKRNKKFAKVDAVTEEEKQLMVASKVPKVEVKVEEDDGVPEIAGFETPESDIGDVMKSPNLRKTSILTRSSSGSNTPYSPSPKSSPSLPCPKPIRLFDLLKDISSPGTPPEISREIVNTVHQLPRPILDPTKPDPLEVLVKEEMKLGERRRFLFCDKEVKYLIGRNRECPFSPTDLKPLTFHDYKLSMKSHILLVFEWIQAAWEEFEGINTFDKLSVLRKCVLYHFLLDPAFLSFQIGQEDRLVMQNGGYISTVDHVGGVGWHDEDDISGENKRKYYVPMMKYITDEIMPGMKAINIDFDEFAALKALACFQGALDTITEPTKELVRIQVNRILLSLHKYYKEKHEEESAERFGHLILMLSNIFSAGNNFVKNHREIDVFAIWDLDALCLQLLNIDSIIEAEKREKAHQLAIRNGLDPGTLAEPYNTYPSWRHSKK